MNPPRHPLVTWIRRRLSRPRFRRPASGPVTSVRDECATLARWARRASAGDDS